MAEPTADPYAALGLVPSASAGEIKQAFRVLAARYHPDRNPAPEAAARFRAVQAAYDVLSDPNRRAALDANRQRNLLDDPLATARELWSDYFQALVAASR